MDVAYLYDGTLPGLFTAIFKAYERREHPSVIAEESGLQVAFGQTVSRIETEEALALRVEDGIRKKMGEEGYHAVWTAFLSGTYDRAGRIYRYVRLGMKIGQNIHSHLSHDDVLPILKMNRQTGWEAHLFTQFIRFSKMENGVYMGKFQPENNILPIIMPHFADRYNDQPFLLYDESYRLAGVYDLKEWYLVEADELTLPDLAEDEQEWRQLWRHFYDTVAVKERVNHKLRMGHMPKRYWKNMIEILR